MIDSLLLIALVLVALAGIVLAALQLPGAWLVLISAVGYDGYYDWQRIHWGWLLGLGLFAALAELLDVAASAAAVRKAGATRRATLGALIGGFAGMILFSVPVPVLGTIIGGLLGCFVGAMVGEWTVREDLGAGARAGLFATIGRLAGIIAKTAAALVIAGVTLVLAITAMV